MPTQRRRSAKQPSRFGYDFPADPWDPPTWDRYVRSQLTLEQRRLLTDAYGRSTARLAAAESQDKKRREQLRALWEEDVLSIHVDVERGRAVLRPTRATGLRIPGRRKQVEEVGLGFRVVLDFEYLPEERAHAVRKAHVIGEEGGPNLGVDLWAYYTAFRLYAAAHPRQRFQPPHRRPAAGQPLDPLFYRRVVQLYDDLKLRGHRAPAVELAERMDTNPATVRSWVYRGRRLPAETGKGGKE